MSAAALHAAALRCSRRRRPKGKNAIRRLGALREFKLEVLKGPNVIYYSLRLAVNFLFRPPDYLNRSIDRLSAPEYTPNKTHTREHVHGHGHTRTLAHTHARAHPHTHTFSALARTAHACIRICIRRAHRSARQSWEDQRLAGAVADESRNFQINHRDTLRAGSEMCVRARARAYTRTTGVSGRIGAVPDETSFSRSC